MRGKEHMKTRKFLRVLCTGILIGAMVVGCGNTNAAYKEQQIIAVGEKAINLDEMMYHVMISEFQGKVIGSYLGGEKAYWESEYEKGVTMAENKKNEIIDDVIKYQIYYEAATKEGLTLDDNEKEQVLETIQNMKNNIGNDAITKTQLTDDQIQTITEKIALATKYYREQIAAATIDEEAVRETINKADYEKQKLQYLFIPTNRKAEDGKVEEVDEETLRGIKEKLQSYRQQFASINKVDKLIIEQEDQGILQSGEIAFDKEEHPFGEEIEIIAQYEGLNEGETSDVFQTKMGCYVIRKVANNSEAAYEKAVKDAENAVREELVNKQYEDMKSKYKIKINDKNWSQIHIGTMTVIDNGNLKSRTIMSKK